MTVTLSRSSVLVAVALAMGCGGGSNPNNPVPPTTAAPQPTPAPSPSPVWNAACAGLPPGPVTRVALAPREQRTDNVIVDMRVRALPNFDEVWCVDASRAHRLTMQLNQRNADGRESCWVNAPLWRTVEDTNNLADGNVGTTDTNGFIGRVTIDSGGRTGYVSIQAELDGVKSYPWQSGSGYRQEPLRIAVMTADDIENECKCIYRGNGQYTGAGCRK